MVSEKTSIAEPAASAEAAEFQSTEVPLPRAKRRRFPVSEKLRILALADACAQGGIGALLRREGIYASSLSTWRAQRDRGDLAPRRRGPKPQQGTSTRAEKKKLMREIQQLRHRLEKAQLIIDMQKKMDFLPSGPVLDDVSNGIKP